MNEIYLAIQNGFADYIAKKKTALRDIVENFSKLFGKTIHLTITSPWHGVSMNILQINPSEETVEKVANVLVKEEFALEKVCKIWTSATEWRLTLDGGLFDFFNAAQIATLTIHQIFVMTCTNKIPKQITETIQAKLADSSISHKKILKDPMFHKVIRLPIIAACDFKYDKSIVREEIKIDPFLSCENYLPTLLFTFETLEVEIRLYEQEKPRENISVAMEFVESTLDRLANGRILDIKRDLRDMQKYSTKQTKVFTEDVVERNTISLTQAFTSLYNDWFSESKLDDFTFQVSKIPNLDESLFLEFGILSKRLEPIEQKQLDYASIKIEGMETINDKMMVVSYLNGKLELVQWYLNILDDPKKKKRYRVPHTRMQLINLSDEIEALKELALKKKLPSGTPELVAYYPKGYEG